MNPYRTKNLKSLFHKYAFENDRIDKKDKETTQNLIREELISRMERTIRFLGEAQSEYEVERIYDHFINY